jgi:hypothetical protein
MGREGKISNILIVLKLIDIYESKCLILQVFLAIRGGYIPASSKTGSLGLN